MAQHHSTGSEASPSYAPRTSRFGSVWRYAIVSCTPETTTTTILCSHGWQQTNEWMHRWKDMLRTLCHHLPVWPYGGTKIKTFWTFGMTVSGGMIGTKLWDTVISLKGHKAALVWLLHPSISVVPHGIIIHWEQRIYFLAATCSLWLECATTEETYMLRLILQILVLVCSSLDQHGDLPGSCHLLMLPKLCAVVSSLQTHPEPVAAELPWYDLQCIQLHIIEHHG